MVQCMPSPIHQCIADAFLSAFHRATADLPPAVDSKFTTTSNENFNAFSGAYDGSEKVPDAAVFLDDINGDTQVKITLEIGFAENYEDLKLDAKLWLEGTHANVVLLVNIYELPAYRSPLRNLSDEERNDSFAHGPTPEGKDFLLDGQLGPVTHRGYKWAGEISSVMLEVWKRHPMTGIAMQDEERIVRSSSVCERRNLPLTEW